MNYITALVCFLFSLVVITLIATLGAIASRKLRFNYAWLGLLSLALYVFNGYYLTQTYSLSMALLVNGLLGFYDGTVSMRLCLYFKARTGLEEEDLKSMISGKTGLTMTTMAFMFTLIGYWLS